MIINDNNKSDDYSEIKMQRCVEYIESLEEERRKIQVFQRELPLCLELVSGAIETCRKELYFQGQSECSEQISSEGPVLEEFIPLKRTSSSEEDEQQSEEAKNISKNQSKYNKSSDKSSKKSDWLRSVQLWNQTPDPPTKVDSPRKVSVVEVKKNGNGGAFHPFKREKIVGTAQPAPAAAASSTEETGGSSGGFGDGCKSENKEDSHRKARRCWSPELHRRFLQALQQLGGAHVATPKQIREIMKVDGLTNDEVKSHLQKYRLHTRRPSLSIHSNNINQAPQFVVVGGIWVPPPEYAASGEAAAAPVHSPPTNGIYAPRATLPAAALAEEIGSSKQRQQSSKEFNSNESGSHSQGRICSDSPTTSSSTQTTRVSPAF